MQYTKKEIGAVFLDQFSKKLQFGFRAFFFLYRSCWNVHCKIAIAKMEKFR